MKYFPILIILSLIINSSLSVELSPLLRIKQSSDRSRSSKERESYIIFHKDSSISTISGNAAFESALSDSTVLSIHASKKVQPLSDSMLVHSNAIDIYTGNNLTQPYTGKGIIIGIVDKGFDYTHPSFRARDSSTRIIRVWNQRDSSGTPPTQFGYGSELSHPDDILNRECDDPNLGSHGTHVSGIAAGSIIDGVPYHGIAPESELIFVTTTYESSHVLDAIDYIFSVAESVGKPAVVNLSLATPYGPHDGTSVEDRGAEQHSSRGVIIASASNSGHEKQHIDFNLSGSDTLKTFTTLPWRNVILDFWGTVNQNFEIKLTIVDSLKTPVHSLPFITTNNEYFDTTINIDDNDLRIQLASERRSTLNSKPEIMIAYSIASGDLWNSHDVELLITGSSGTVHGWNGMYSSFQTRESPSHTAGDSWSTLGDGFATSKGTISVGSFVSKRSYYNWMDEEITINDSTATGDLSLFSSKGPTIDGRTGPDITAPGHEIISAEGSTDNNLDSSKVALFYEYNGKSYPFAARHGTSQSAPVVSGAAALILEADPTLTWIEINTLLQSTAKQDYFVNEINFWGAGKIDIDSAIKLIDPYETGVINNSRLLPKISYKSIGSKIEILNRDQSPLTISLFSLNGKKILSRYTERKSLTINTKSLAKGIYFLSIKNRGTTSMTKLMIR